MPDPCADSAVRRSLGLVLHHNGLRGHLVALADVADLERQKRMTSLNRDASKNATPIGSFLAGWRTGSPGQLRSLTNGGLQVSAIPRRRHLADSNSVPFLFEPLRRPRYDLRASTVSTPNASTHRTQFAEFP